MLTFNQIPIDLRTPGQYVEFDSSRAVSGPQAQPHRVLVIGQKLATGAATANVPVRITSADEAVQQFGRGSMLALMFAAFLANNPINEAWAFPMADNAAGVQATKTITVTGTVTSPGSVHVYIGGQRVLAAVATGDDAGDVGDKVASALQAALDLPMTAQSNGAGVITLTARHKGVTGSDIDVRLNYREGERTPAGVALAIASATAGTGNPDASAVFTAIGDDWFNTFVMPWTDTANLDVFDAALAERFGPMKMIEGVAVAFKAGTYGDLADFGEVRNGPHVAIAGLKGSPTPPPVIAAALAAQAAGSAAIDPARPLQTLVLRGVLAPAVGDRFTREERDLLLHDGIATLTVDAGGNVCIERLITTYQTNAYGLPDAAYLDIETLYTISYLRWATRGRIGTKYARHKLADDGTQYGAGQAVVTPKVIRAELISLFREWESIGLVEDIEAFKRDLIVQRDAGDPNRLNALIPPDLVNQFRVFAGQVQFRL